MLVQTVEEVICRADAAQHSHMDVDPASATGLGSERPAVHQPPQRGGRRHVPGRRVRGPQGHAGRQRGAVDVRESKQSATMKMVFCLVQRGANNIARETAGKSG